MKKLLYTVIISIFLIAAAIYFCRNNFFTSMVNNSYSYVESKSPDQIDSADFIYSFNFTDWAKISIAAKDIVWECLNTEFGSTKNNDERMITFSKENSYGFFCDLNDDGKDEIIGTIYSSTFWGNLAGTYFILKENKGSYDCISDFIVHAGSAKIFIFRHKTLGWHDIAVFNEQTKLLDIYKNTGF